MSKYIKVRYENDTRIYVIVDEKPGQLKMAHTNDFGDSYTEEGLKCEYVACETSDGLGFNLDGAQFKLNWSQIEALKVLLELESEPTEYFWMETRRL